jgi:hypothetical protein
VALECGSLYRVAASQSLGIDNFSNITGQGSSQGPRATPEKEGSKPVVASSHKQHDLSSLYGQDTPASSIYRVTPCHLQGGIQRDRKVLLEVPVRFVELMC